MGLTGMCLVVLLGQEATHELVFGANTSQLSIDMLIDYATPQGMPGNGVITFFNEETTYLIFQPYQGMYLWSQFDQRLDALNEVLPAGGTMNILHAYTPRCLVGWYHAPTIPAGESNKRSIDNEWYADDFDALINRYGPDGFYPLATGRQISSWALWTEPDGGSLMMGAQEFIDKDDPKDGLIAYFNIARLAAEKIRELDPDAEIVAGGFLSPCSPRPLQGNWLPHARRCIQLMFSGEEDSINSVPFGWEVAPDVIDWHAYDFMKLDLEGAEEWHYDPLVLDPDDPMHWNRPGELYSNLPDWFDGSLEPVWGNLGLFNLEYCPMYSRHFWRHTGEFPEGSHFYTQWRANFFVTSTLQLIESGHMYLNSAMMSCMGYWWCEQLVEDGSWGMIPNDNYPNACDKAHHFMCAELDGMYLDEASHPYNNPDRADVGRLASAQGEDCDGFHVAYWRFKTGISFPEQYIHVLRKYRDAPESGFSPDVVDQIEIAVLSNVESLDIYDMEGEYITNVIPAQGIASVPVTGFVRYALENLCSDGSCLVGEHQNFQAHYSSDSGELVIFAPAEVAGIRVFDLTGRLITEEVTGIQQSGLQNRTFSIDGNMPSSCYLIAGVDAEGMVIATTKVVIW